MNRFFSFFTKISFGKNAVIAILFMLAMSVLVSFISPMISLYGFVLTLVYAIIVIILGLRGHSDETENGDRSLIMSISRDFLIKTDYAMALLDEKNRVVWFNTAFSDICGKSVYGTKISDIIKEDFHEETLEELRRGNSVLCKIGNSFYDMQGYPTSSYRKNCFFVIFQNIDETEELKAELHNKRAVVALVVIDNYAEVTRFLGDNHRSALTDIGNCLDSFAESIGGVIKEYEKNQFLLIFQQEKLEEVISSKFEVLDAVKSIVAEGVSVPFTASIGVANVDGNFSEKLSVARAALDLALTRGGDQAVVKTDDSTEFFGGKLKGVQKRTKIRSRVIAEELSNFIKNSGNVIIMGHKYADHDSIASCIGISKLSRAEGKETHIIINIHDANLKPIFAMMRGKTEYLDLFTDAVAAQDYLRSDTLLIICDVNNPRQFEAPDIFAAAENIAIIDHHRKTGDYELPAKIAYIEPSSSSASELVSEILEHSLEPGELSSFEADLLFSGILLDTKQFTKNTGVRTFGAALYLRSEGANPVEAQKLFRTDIQEFLREAHFETDVKIYFDQVAISKYEGETENSDRISMAKAADRLLGVSGIKASFVMCEIDGDICISARSDGTINVQLILEELGGGGHYDAAAAQIKDKTLDEAHEELISACAAYLKK